MRFLSLLPRHLHFGLLLALAAGFLAAHAAAQTTISATSFEGAPEFSAGYFYTYAFDYAGYGNGGPDMPLGNSVVESAADRSPNGGVNAGGALVFSANANAVPAPGQPYPGLNDPPVEYSYYGFGGGTGLAVYAAPTSGNLEDFVLSLQIRAAGLLVNSAGADLVVEFQAPDGTLNAGFDDASDLLVRLVFEGENQAPLRPTFAPFSLNLSRFTRVDGGSLQNFASFASTINNVNIGFSFNGAAEVFGLDNDNQVFVDEMTLIQVPEPANVSLFAAGALALGCCRRRRVQLA